MTLIRLPITVLIPTRNEAINLPKALNSIHDLVEQICVVDSESSDNTLSIVQEYGAETYILGYQPGKIIPWILQWSLDNLPIRHDWVMILEADREIPPQLATELRALFAHGDPPVDGYYIRREMIFRGKLIKHGSYGSKMLLTLFRRQVSRLDAEEEDTRVYVDGKVSQLKYAFVENNLKEADILFYLQKHLRYAEAFARDELKRRKQVEMWKVKPSLFGTPDQRTLWLKTQYYRSPLYVRPFIYYFYRYFLRLGFLDGKQGAIFHFLQAFWFRLIVDIRLEELIAEQKRTNIQKEI